MSLLNPFKKSKKKKKAAARAVLVDATVNQIQAQRAADAAAAQRAQQLVLLGGLGLASFLLLMPAKKGR